MTSSSLTSSTSIPDEIAQKLRAAQHIAVMTGAGVSAESGIATFRDALTGLWANFKAEDLATPQAFVRDPALVWGWYEWRRAQVMQTQPNAGHIALAAMARQVPQLTLITQNVDDLHERAGSSAVLHLHGSILAARCFDCGFPYQHRASLQQDHAKLAPPVCPECGGAVRPGVVWFGENLPHDVWQEAERAVRECDVLIIAGTSGVVYPAAGLAELAFRKRKTIIQINPQATNQDKFASLVMTGPSGVCLPQLLAAAWPELR
ncbi:MAG: NAD-dependent deacylase [Burkholderiales bacterium]|nr:NAD-dependent deacylase [Burkholderiales bacterium]